MQVLVEVRQAEAGRAKGNGWAPTVPSTGTNKDKVHPFSRLREIDLTDGRVAK